ncbi:MAG: hypothetical protein ABEJ36_04125 [Candidatus Nanosalina sp.]
MRAKISSLIALLLGLTSLASAQVTETGFVGIIPLITQILGIRANLFSVLGFVATYGVINLFVYMFFKIVARTASEKTDYISSRDLFGGSDGRNLIAILSVLFTLSGVFGAGAAGIINGFQSLIVLTILLGLLVGFAMVFLGGGGAALGSVPFAGGLGARALGKGTKEGAKQVGGDRAAKWIGEKGSQAVKKAKERAEGAWKDARSDNYTDAEKEFEQAVETLENLVPGLGEELENLDEEIQTAKEELEDAMGDEREEYEKLEDLGTRIKRIREFLQSLAESGFLDTEDGDYIILPDSQSPDRIDEFFSGDMNPGVTGASYDVDMPSTYGVAAIQDDIESIQKDLKIVQGDFEEESGEVIDAVKKFDDTVAKAAKSRVLLKKIINVLNELEEGTEEFESIEEKEKLQELHNRTESVISEEAKIEDIVSELEDYESDIKSKVEEVLEETEEFLQYDEAEIQDLRDELDWEGTLYDLVQAYRAGLRNRQNEEGDINNYSDKQGALTTLHEELGTIHDELEEILDEMSDEEENIVGRMRDRLSGLRGGDEMTEEIQSELSDWLDQSRFA